MGNGVPHRSYVRTEQQKSGVALRLPPHSKIFSQHLMSVLEGDFGSAAEHAGNFGGAAFTVEQLHFGVGAAVLNTFRYGEVRGSAGGNLG